MRKVVRHYGAAMAFVRTKKVKGGEYRQLVESRRVDGKPRQKVLVHLGAMRSVEEALEVWPRVAGHHRRRARIHREGAEMIRQGAASARWRGQDFRGSIAYLVPDPMDEPTEEVRTLRILLGGAPAGQMYLHSADEGETTAEDHDRKAEALERKVEDLRRLRREGRA